jgi:small GTP-binding protein
VECYDKVKFIEDKKYQIKVWDTAGQEKFAVMAKSYYQRAHGIIVTCALNNRNTFYNLKNWLNSIKENTDTDTIQLIILANKCDLKDEREVETSEIADKARELGIEYFETSAKENIEIDEAFNKIIDKVFNAVYNKERGISLNSGQNSKSNDSGKRCC